MPDTRPVIGEPDATFYETFDIKGADFRQFIRFIVKYTRMKPLRDQSQYWYSLYGSSIYTMVMMRKKIEEEDPEDIYF